MGNTLKKRSQWVWIAAIAVLTIVLAVGLLWNNKTKTSETATQGEQEHAHQENEKDEPKQDEKDEKQRYIRKERYSGHYERSFYVGDAITEDDIKAKFKDGVLTMEVPKKEAQPKVEETKRIAIEG